VGVHGDVLGPRISSGVFFPSHAHWTITLHRLDRARTLHREEQRFQIDDISSIFCGRIRALESINESDASHHSPDAIEQSQGNCRNRRMEKAVPRRLEIF